MLEQAVELTRRLVDIPSVTGKEKDVGDFLFDLLRQDGWVCRRQTVESDRFNLLATRGDPDVLLSTHMDTVPPFIPSSLVEDRIHGRGACDAKGVIAAMVIAARQLAAEGLGDRIGLLLLVGEETDSIGAKTAARRLGVRCRYLINGEPTDNCLASGHKGIYSCCFRASGKAAHSGYPEQGESAIEKLLDALQRLRRASFPNDPVLGPSCVNIGMIRGGRASNVIADQAEAQLLIRTVTAGQEYRRRLEQIAAGQVEIADASGSEPQRLAIVGGFATKPVAFGTDIPALRPLGTPLLYGPGSILLAHTPEESLSKRELRLGIEGYVRLVKRLLQPSCEA